MSNSDTNNEQHEPRITPVALKQFVPRRPVPTSSEHKPVQPLDWPPAPRTFLHDVVDGARTAWQYTTLAAASVPHFFTLIRGLVSMNWKTTAVGIVGVLALVVKMITGVEVGAEVQSAFLTVLFFVGMFFAKDKDVTGGQRPQ